MISAIVTTWWAWLWSSFWQLAVLVALVALADVLLRRWAWPQLRLAMWSIPLAKLVIPPSWNATFSVTSGLFDHGSVPYLVQGVAQTLEQPLAAAPLSGALAAGATASSGDAPAWLVALFVVWFAVAVLLMAGYVLRVRRLRRRFLSAGATANELPDWLGALHDQTARELGLRRVPHLIVSAEIASPAVFGVSRPVVLLPASFLDISRSDLRNVLLHELTHVKRGDLLVQRVIAMLQILYWINPLVYVVRRRLHELREVCCDASVSMVLREQTPAYRQTLVDAARRLMNPPPRIGLEALGLYENGRTIVRRLRSLERRHWENVGWRRAATTGLLGAAVFALPMAPPAIQEGCPKPVSVAVAADAERELTRPWSVDAAGEPLTGAEGESAEPGPA